MSQKIRIKLKSYDYSLVDKSAEKIVKTVKASWLSAEKNIKNPYYGSSMLTCGSVKSELK